MTRSVTNTRMSARPCASVLALLFLLVTVAAPAVDTWLHAGDDGAAAQQHSGADDCIVCRLAATPSAPPPAAETMLADAAVPELPRFAPVQAQVRAAPARLTPPTRAPPA